MTENSLVKTGQWTCHKCGCLYPNTMLYCPKCNIARKHSKNMWRDHPFEGCIDE